MKELNTYPEMDLKLVEFQSEMNKILHKQNPTMETEEGLQIHLGKDFLKINLD